ncbi:MAG: cytochrome c [Bacteroidetes bacterium]|nr:cytochrome c [Bacteroidota bacterium]MBT7827120.1 cytochrome c [Bacteroidota bacterium]
MISLLHRMSVVILSFLLITSTILILSSCGSEDNATEVDDEIALLAEEETSSGYDEEGNLSEFNDFEEDFEEPGIGSEKGLLTGSDKTADAKTTVQAPAKTTDEKSLVQQKTTKETRKEVTTINSQEEVQETKKAKEVVAKNETEIIPKKVVESTYDGWNIPSKYVSMTNPYKSNTDISIGKSLYSKLCKSCHGASGKGDGPKAMSLNSNMRSFSSPEFKVQKAGIIYYKSYIGRDEMPNFEKKISDEEDRWLLINYIMSLK